MSVSARNRDGLSAIHLAAIANNLQVLKLFAEEMGKNVEVISTLHCEFQKDAPFEILRIQLLRSLRGHCERVFGMFFYAIHLRTDCGEQGFHLSHNFDSHNFHLSHNFDVE